MPACLTPRRLLPRSNAELGIEPGPELGAALAELEAAQYAGEVADRAGALQHLRR